MSPTDKTVFSLYTNKLKNTRIIFLYILEDAHCPFIQRADYFVCVDTAKYNSCLLLPLFYIYTHTHMNEKKTWNSRHSDGAKCRRTTHPAG